MTARTASAVALLVVSTASVSVLAQEVRIGIGSKKFTESVILGEMLTLLAEDAGAKVVHRRQLGGTRVLWNALLAGEIDAYPEYTGTIAGEVLADRGLSTVSEMRDALSELGVLMSAPLGFENTYALGMREEVAAERGVRKISDLGRHPHLRLAFTAEFMNRADGWPGLRDRYALPHAGVKGLDHDLAYKGLQGGTIDVTDFYSTDAKIAEHGLRVLEDDLEYFPEYYAVILCREDMTQRASRAVSAMLALVGRIDVKTMVALNARAKVDRLSESRVAADFLLDALGVKATVHESTRLERIAQRTLEHLFLVGLSLVAAILVSIPFGVVAAKRPRAGHVILAVAGVLQTIPSLVLLVVMIPLLGIGEPPAIFALFLYSLLPIVRNTHAGLTSVPPDLQESALALGLPFWTKLRQIELPLASRSILAGIKTSGVINVGTATLGAIIGAGGYGQPILTGIRLDDLSLILEGAVPAATMAIAVQLGFDFVERWLVPRGLRMAR